MKLINRLKTRYSQYKSHPVTQDRELRALYKYVKFHIVNNFVKTQTFSWLADLKYLARKGDAGIIGNISFGLYEFEESIFLLHFLEHEDLFLDVGANLGHYSLLMSGIKKCNSIALEPVPETFQQLCKQIQVNNLVPAIDARNMGVSNKNGKTYFSTDKSTMNRVVNENYKPAVEVTVSTIDDILRNKCAVAIKIDVEGYEGYVLEGAKETIENRDLKVIVIELNNSGQKYGFDDPAIAQKLTDCGFKPYSYNPLNRTLKLLTTFNKDKFNTIFIRDISYVMQRVEKSESIVINKKTF